MHIFISAISARLGYGQTYLLNLFNDMSEGVHIYALVQPDIEHKVPPGAYQNSD